MIKRVHLDIQPYYKLENKDYRVACGKAYSDVTRADVPIFSLPENEKPCENCLELYNMNKELIDSAYEKGVNLKISDLKTKDK